MGRRWVVVTLVVLAVAVPAGWAVLGRLTAPADGTMTYPSAPPWTAGGVVLSGVAGHAGDLRVGDRVVAVDGMPLETWVSHRPARTFRAGDHIRYRVVRPGDAPDDPAVESDVDVVLRAYPIREMIVAHGSGLPLVVLMLAVASFVFLHRPADPAARALFAMAALVPMGLTAFPFATQVIDLANGPRLWPFIVGDLANALLWGALLHFALVFPQPRGFVRRHPRSVVAAYAIPFALHGVYVAATLPFASGALERLGRLVPTSLVAGHVFPFLVGAVMIAGYRAAPDGPTRRRMRWVFVTFSVAAVLYVGLGQLPDKVVGHPLVPWDWQPLFFLPFPLALGAAVLRYGLFDIEVILRRSLVYGGLTALLVVVYLGTVALLSRLLDAGTGAVPLLATAVVALLFQPLRVRLKRVISRTMFGDRDDPYEVLTRLGSQLETAVRADSVLARIVETLAQALRLSYAAIELTGPEGTVEAAARGAPVGKPLSIPLVHLGEEVGRLVLDMGPGREPFGPADRRLLDALAHQVGPAAYNVLLTARLQRSLERTVNAREEERRRLRRDIHDGVGPALAADAMRLDVARGLLHSDPAKAGAILDDVAQARQDVVADIRRLVEGLRPPALDQLGLVAAVRDRAETFTALHVTVEADENLEPLPAAVEVAAYLIVVEALTNVVRHASARRCTVRLWSDGALLVEVSDDGAGLPTGYRAGVGLTSMRERATELGGDVVVAPGPDGGTAVRARLPLPPSPLEGTA